MKHGQSSAEGVTPGARIPDEPTAPGVVLPALNAIRYLLAMQSLNGGWWDFNVSIGLSGPWVTGIVGEVLNECRGPLRSPALESALSRAVRYLQMSRLSGSGWGYNEALPADCDSTAYALIFLHSMGAGIEDSAVACLRTFQRDDGAFLTYMDAPPNHSWGSIHYDVHGAAVRASARVLGPAHQCVRKGVQHSFERLNDDPVWPAFWWKTQVYSVFQNLISLADLGEVESIPDTKKEDMLRMLSDETPLSTALSGMTALVLQRNADALKLQHRLLNSQLRDGSWPSSRALRVTNADCFAPWSRCDDSSAGPLYSDTRRIFTTALALRFLLRTSE